MKNIKLRIVYLILCSALLLFALFMLAVNLIIPAHFVREAKKALISEAQYQNRTIPYTDEESFFDDGWNDTEEHFLTPNIVNDLECYKKTLFRKLSESFWHKHAKNV